MIRKLFCGALVCLLCVSWAGSCSAASYTITDAELTRLETIFSELKINNEKLRTDLLESKADLQTAKSKLDESQKQLETLQAQLAQLRIESSKVKAESMEAQDSLAKANQSLQEYEREVKGQIKSLSWQRNLLAAALIWVAARK